MGCNYSCARRATSANDTSKQNTEVETTEQVATGDIQIIKPVANGLDSPKTGPKEDKQPESTPAYFEASVELIGQTGPIRHKCYHPIDVVELGDEGAEAIDGTRPTTSLEFVSLGPGELLLTVRDEKNCLKRTHSLFFEESSVIVLQHFLKKNKAYIVIYTSSASAKYAKYLIFEARPSHRAFTAMFISISIVLSIALKGRVFNQLAPREVGVHAPKRR